MILSSVYHVQFYGLDIVIVVITFLVGTINFLYVKKSFSFYGLSTLTEALPHSFKEHRILLLKKLNRR